MYACSYYYDCNFIKDDRNDEDGRNPDNDDHHYYNFIASFVAAGVTPCSNSRNKEITTTKITRNQFNSKIKLLINKQINKANTILVITEIMKKLQNE